MMVALANKDGGIMGHPVKLISADNRFDPSVSAQLERSYLQGQHIDMVYGDLNDAILQEEATLARQFKAPTTAAAGSGVSFINGSDSSIYTGMTVPTSWNDACVVARYIGLRHPEWKRIVNLVGRFSAGTTEFDAFKNCLARYAPQSKIVGRVDFDFSTTNWLSVINAVLANKPDFIVVATSSSCSSARTSTSST